MGKKFELILGELKESEGVRYFAYFGGSAGGGKTARMRQEMRRNAGKRALHYFPTDGYPHIHSTACPCGLVLRSTSTTGEYLHRYVESRPERLLARRAQSTYPRPMVEFKFEGVDWRAATEALRDFSKAFEEMRRKRG